MSSQGPPGAIAMQNPRELCDVVNEDAPGTSVFCSLQQTYSDRDVAVGPAAPVRAPVNTGIFMQEKVYPLSDY